ncbi:MAG: peptidylprolyl isomerase [Bacteroidota bacterium]|nr:peptidylprolyl isomerase [Bacteroidota bacterium]
MSLVKLSIIAILAYTGFSCTSADSSMDQTEMVPLFPTENRTEEVAVISTKYGEMIVRLYDATPEHKANFLKLAKEGFYDSTTFHRIIEGFMVQGGDPNSKDDNLRNDGQGGPGYTLPAEIVRGYIHKKGALAAARMGNDTNPDMRSSGSQFYIVHGRQRTERDVDQLLAQANNNIEQGLISTYVGSPENTEVKQRIDQAIMDGNTGIVSEIITEIKPLATKDFEPLVYTPQQREVYMTQGGVPYLDGSYTVFGEVIQGLAVVDSIVQAKKNYADRPVEDIPMIVRVQTKTLTPDGSIIEQ